MRNGVPVLAPEALDGGEGFDERSFDHLPAAEERSFWFRARNDLIVWALRRYFADAGSMLEIGCGTGFVLAGVRAAVPELRLVGAELFPAGLEVAARRVPEAELVQLDARTIPFREEFDVAGAFDVLEHVDEDERVLAELRSALRPRGGLLLTVPQHPRLWSVVDEYSRHVRRYRREELVTKVRAAGFEILRRTSFVSLLLPVLVASRMRLRRQQSFDPLAEYRGPPLIDSALGWVLAAERTLIRAGLTLPAGGSLLLVARRR
jgi:SAM-dependent methyltransferase